jgi:glycosyltransferase involved in cell wall biosynthesis
VNDHFLDILFITHRRPKYTAKSLERLLNSCTKDTRVWVWHNGSDVSTLETVKSFLGHPNFHHLEVSKDNKKLREPTNWFWNNSDGGYVGKVDDDCLLPPDWINPLLAAHKNNQSLGAIGCWLFYDDDYLPAIASKKTKPLNGGGSVLSNCWVGGSGYIMKRKLVNELGPLKDNESFTDYCLRSSLLGWNHGWYFPFIHQEHMDDPRSTHCDIKTEEDFQSRKPLTAINFNIENLEEWKARVKEEAATVQRASPNPKHHTGWCKRMKNIIKRIKKMIGAKEPWQQ